MKRRGCVTTLFGAGALLLICAVIFAFNARDIVMWAGGFGGGSDTAEVLQDIAVEAEPSSPVVGETEGQSEVQAPAAAVERQTKLETVTLQQYGQQRVVDVAATGAESAEQVQNDSGETEIVVTYNEADLNQVLVETVIAQAPAETQQQVRNLEIELVEGAAVLSAEANLGFFWQPFSVILTYDNASDEIEVAGLDINGAFFETPPEGIIGDQLDALEAQANSALDNASLVGPNGELLTVDEVAIVDGRVAITAR